MVNDVVKLTAYDAAKKALESPTIDSKLLDSDCIKAILSNPSVQFVSEWKHTVRILRYEYHCHKDDLADLRHYFNNGSRFGNPSLVRIYSRSDLESLL